MGRHSGTQTSVQYGGEGLPDDALSGGYAAVPQQGAYGQAQQDGYAGGLADTSYAGAYPGQDTGYHDYPADPGYGGYQAAPQGGLGYDGGQQHGWEHPAPEAGSGTWTATGTMPGEPAHWDDPLEPYGAQAASGGYAAQTFGADTFNTDTFNTDGFGTDTFGATAFATGSFGGDAYGADSYGADPYATGGYTAVGHANDLYAADGYPSGMHAVVEAPAAPMYDTTTFEPQSFVGYGYDTSGAYQAVSPVRDPLVDALYEMPAESAQAAGPGAGQYAMEAEPWAVSAPELDLEQLSFATEPGEDFADAESESAYAVEPEPEYGFEPDAGSAPPKGRAQSRRANRPAPRKGRRTLVAASGAVVTGAVLAGAVVLQMPDEGTSSQASGDDQAGPGAAPRPTDQAASRSSDRDPVAQGGASSLPLPTPASPTTTDQLTVRFPLDPKLGLSGSFDTVPGKEAAPGPGRKYTYAVEIEQGLQLDGELFATTVQKTLNDKRSWATGGLTFERTDNSPKADFVVRLASPQSVHKACTPLVGDTSADNVSCDAYGTRYVMINAWRWAQGSTAYGDDIVGYRQMLINHEVGHRLGHNHEKSCGAGGIGSNLAPVMMQQTKTRVASEGAMKGETCEANPWPYPTGKLTK
ncbi:DUF3152 domain-containing protein [Embleya sp. NBC_00888]|uniref:DUF3152 domain-containing protein n=1 Tax=Embleya sp. NBC_00888 TaxID=2975960 RepID=UPI0038699A4E|nr:DUF3152 domain-containing protein [Embleya sp. NBC_00888]